MIRKDGTEWLLSPDHLYSADETSAALDCPPPVPGVYGWYFRQLPVEVPVGDCATNGDWVLAYVGISPSDRTTADGRASAQNLRSRVRYHFRGNAEGSTLRLTLGCLLRDELGTELRRVGSGRRMTFGDAESELSSWMRDKARVVWHECAEPWILEDALIHRPSLPLNLHGNDAHPFQATLTRIRAEAKTRARELPVVS